MAVVDVEDAPRRSGAQRDTQRISRGAHDQYEEDGIGAHRRLQITAAVKADGGGDLWAAWGRGVRVF